MLYCFVCLHVVIMYILPFYRYEILFLIVTVLLGNKVCFYWCVYNHSRPLPFIVCIVYLFLAFYFQLICGFMLKGP